MPKNERVTDGDGARPPWTFTRWAIWLGHAIGAALAWWLLPGGFPWQHPHFWTNRMLPWVVVAVAAVGLVGARRKNALARQSAAVFVVATWTSALVASTKPWNNSLTWPEVPCEVEPTASRLQIGSSATLSPTSAELEVRFGRMTVSMRPLLRFERVSPDGCWTIFTPPAYRPRSRLELVGTLGDAEGWYCYQSSFVEHLLRVEPEADGDGMLVEVLNRLQHPVFSHLNSFCELTISGHQRVILSFSPCPEIRIEPLASDYPLGKPARFAYVDQEGMFHVVEAQSAEKGPFRTLGQGKLGDAPLQVTIYDAGHEICRVVLEDWARQAGRQLSPTAGWSVPVNTLEFSRLDDSPTALVWLWMSLSSTSVGRGWDSVGHSAGIYRNRLRIEPVSDGK